MRSHLLLGVLLTAACSSDSEQPDPRPQTADEAAAVSATRAADMATVMADIDQFVASGFTGWLPGVTGGVPVFTLPANCQGSISIDRTKIQLGGECTLPSGRHTKGTLDISLGVDCGLLGITVAF